jgi:protein-disulfide isomerase
LEQASIDAKIEKVTDIPDIMSYGVMSTPALVIDDKVVSYGKVLSFDEIIKLLK